MRSLLLVPLCLAAAACSKEAPTNDSAPAATPATMPTGQYSVDSKVTEFRPIAANQKPAVTYKAGDKASSAACVTGAPPPPELFGDAGYTCSYKSNYIKDGMINASLGCTRKGGGQIQLAVEGSYTAAGFEATVDTTSYFGNGGDFTMSRKLSGKLTGPSCAPVTDGKEGADGNKAAAAKAG